MTAKTGLDIMGIPTLFQSIANERKTGTLKMQNNAEAKYVYFRSGKIVQVSSSQRPSILAEGLRRHPELEESAYRALCEEQRKTGKSLAALLLAEEDGAALVTAICQFQILEEICELFTWENCHSEFSDGAPDAMFFDLEIMNIEAVDTSMVLLEGARRSDEWKMILQLLPSRKDVPYKTGKGNAENKEDKVVFAVVDGFRDIEDILSLIRLSPFEGMNSLVSLIKKEVLALKNEKDLMQMARLDVFRENLHKRIRIYERAIELGDKNREIVIWLARAYETMGMRDRAAQQYSKFGYNCLYSEAYSDSIQAFEKASQLNPENIEIHERLAALLAKTNRLEEYAGKTTTFARWLSLQGERNRAIWVLREATEKFPQNLANLDMLAALYQECGYRAEAAQVYQELAKLQVTGQDYQGATKTYHKMIVLQAENLEIRKLLCGVLEKMDRNEEAVEHYRAMGKMAYEKAAPDNTKEAEYLIFASQKIIAQQPSDLSARKWLAETYLMQNQKDKAQDQFSEILQRFDASKHDLTLLVETLKSLVSLQPNDLESRFKLAETYLKIKREREAIQEYFAIGVTATEMGKNSKALEALDRLLSFDPSNYASRLKKAEIFIQQKHNDRAIEELMLTGYLSIGADKLWQAVKAFRQVLSLDRANVQCYLELGKLYERLLKPGEAVAAYKKHVQKNVKLNNFGQAITSCEAILRLEPKNGWAQTAKQKLTEMVPNKS
jgi:thioredoxin-like negative regulator of GroEL